MYLSKQFVIRPVLSFDLFWTMLCYLFSVYILYYTEIHPVMFLWYMYILNFVKFFKFCVKQFNLLGTSYSSAVILNCQMSNLRKLKSEFCSVISGSSETCRICLAVIWRQAMVESQFLHLGACVVWNMGWRVYVMHDQHIRSHHISANWLDGG